MDKIAPFLLSSDIKSLIILFLDLIGYTGSFAIMAKNTPVMDIDQEFTLKRTNARYEDAKAIESEKLSPADLQRRNSLLPEDFWDNSKIDLEALAVGKNPQGIFL